MNLTVRYTDGTEEAFQVGPTTKLGGLPVEGGQVVLSEDIVERLELGNIQYADDHGRIDADQA